jgi:transcriptional regulator with XRE-family HTH domain
LPTAPKTAHHKTARFRRAAGALAKRVRALREGKGWTVEKAAERLGVEPAHVRRIEGARANPTLALLVSAAAAFGMHVSELLAPDAAGRDP